MCDEDVGQASCLLNLLQQLKHLSLDGDIERADCFIADDNFWIDTQSPGNSDTLSLST